MKAKWTPKSIIYLDTAIRHARAPARMRYYLRGVNRVVPCSIQYLANEPAPDGFIFVQVVGKEANERKLTMRLCVPKSEVLYRAKWFGKMVPFTELEKVNALAERMVEHSRQMQRRWDAWERMQACES